MLRLYLFVLAGMATVVHVPLDFHYYCVNTYRWQVEQPLWQMLSQIVMNHVGRCYAKVADGIATIERVMLFWVLRC